MVLIILTALCPVLRCLAGRAFRLSRSRTAFFTVVAGGDRDDSALASSRSRPAAARAALPAAPIGPCAMAASASCSMAWRGRRAAAWPRRGRARGRGGRGDPTPSPCPSAERRESTDYAHQNALACAETGYSYCGARAGAGMRLALTFSTPETVRVCWYQMHPSDCAVGKSLHAIAHGGRVGVAGKACAQCSRRATLSTGSPMELSRE